VVVTTVESVESITIVTMDKCMKGQHAVEKLTEENNRQITGMGCSATTRPCRRRQMVCHQEQAAPHRLVSGSVAWCRPFVMACVVERMGRRQIFEKKNQERMSHLEPVEQLK
jgi:hypothetical protein